MRKPSKSPEFSTTEPLSPSEMFELICDLQQSFLLKAFHLTGNKETAKDLRQITQTKALSNRLRFQRGTSFPNRLRTIMVNTNKDRARAKKQYVPLDPDIHLHETNTNDGYFNLMLQEAHHVLDKLRIQGLHRILELLQEGLDQQQIAEKLNVSDSTVSSIVSRARIAIKKRLSAQ